MKITAFDIGGTFVKYGVFEDGVLTPLGELPTRGEEGAAALLERLYNVAKSLMPAQGIGISARGQIDHDAGKVVADLPVAIKDYNGADIKGAFAPLGIPVCVDNDVNCMGQAQAAAYSEYKNMLCLTFGTGIGGAIIIDREVYRGAGFCAGEAGMMYLNGDYYENSASVSALIKRACAIDPALTDGRKVTAAMERAEIKACVENWAKDAAMGIASLIHIFDPQAVVLGGGIMENETVFGLIESKTAGLVAPGFAAKLKPARGGNRAGLMGAAMMCEKFVSF